MVCDSVSVTYQASKIASLVRLWGWVAKKTTEEKPKVSEALNQYETIMLKLLEAFATIKYGDICWPTFNTAFVWNNKGQGVMQCLYTVMDCSVQE